MAARQNPEDPQSWINLAAVRMDNRENGSRAREACETALRLAPTNVEALGLKLQLCSDQEDSAQRRSRSQSGVMFNLEHPTERKPHKETRLGWPGRHPKPATCQSLRRDVCFAKGGSLLSRRECKNGDAVESFLERRGSILADDAERKTIE